METPDNGFGENRKKYRGASKDRLANGLGWFSIGLGLTEVLALGTFSQLIGIRPKSKSRTVLRYYGIREIAAPRGCLTRSAVWPMAVEWVWDSNSSLPENALP